MKKHFKGVSKKKKEKCIICCFVNQTRGADILTVDYFFCKGAAVCFHVHENRCTLLLTVKLFSLKSSSGTERERR